MWCPVASLIAGESVLLGGYCISRKTSSQIFLSLAPRGKFPGATELSLYCSSVSLHIFLFTIFVFCFGTFTINKLFPIGDSNDLEFGFMV